MGRFQRRAHHVSPCDAQPDGRGRRRRRQVQQTALTPRASTSLDAWLRLRRTRALAGSALVRWRVAWCYGRERACASRGVMDGLPLAASRGPWAHVHVSSAGMLGPVRAVGLSVVVAFFGQLSCVCVLSVEQMD